jgi:rubrerythrin
MQVKGTQTEKNLMIAFAGESQARNRYSFYSSTAKKEGFEQISRIFAETADQESAHAKRLYKLLAGGEVEIRASFPAAPIGKTIENLKAAAAGERYEWTEMYPSFARTAQEEGLEPVARAFEAIAVAEQQHEKQYAELARNLEAGQVFRKDRDVVWRCIKCGYLHHGAEAPAGCPACSHPQSHFEILRENW